MILTQHEIPPTWSPKWREQLNHTEAKIPGRYLKYAFNPINSQQFPMNSQPRGWVDAGDTMILAQGSAWNPAVASFQDIPRHPACPNDSKCEVWLKYLRCMLSDCLTVLLGDLLLKQKVWACFCKKLCNIIIFFSRHNIILYTHVYSCLIIILILRDSILYNIQTLSQNAECQDNVGACWWLSWSDYWTELPTTFSGSFGDRLITRHLKHSSQRIEKNQMDVLPRFVANCLTPPSHCVTIFYQLFFTNADGPYVQHIWFRYGEEAVACHHIAASCVMRDLSCWSLCLIRRLSATWGERWTFFCPLNCRNWQNRFQANTSK